MSSETESPISRPKKYALTFVFLGSLTLLNTIGVIHLSQRISLLEHKQLICETAPPPK